MTKAGNRPVRWRAPELAWSGVRSQPESALSCWFTDRFGSGGKRVRRMGMMAVARKLLMALWRFLDTGEFPEGAALKEAYAIFQRIGTSQSWCWWRLPGALPGLCRRRRRDGVPSHRLSSARQRRREHRVTGVCTRTERRALATRGPHATGSRQTDRGQVTKR